MCCPMLTSWILGENFSEKSNKSKIKINFEKCLCTLSCHLSLSRVIVILNILLTIWASEILFGRVNLGSHSPGLVSGIKILVNIMFSCCIFSRCAVWVDSLHVPLWFPLFSTRLCRWGIRTDSRARSAVWWPGASGPHCWVCSVCPANTQLKT